MNLFVIILSIVAIPDDISKYLIVFSSGSELLVELASDEKESVVVVNGSSVIRRRQTSVLFIHSYIPIIVITIPIN